MARPVRQTVCDCDHVPTFLFALILPLLFSIPYLGYEGWIYRALAFLIAASPCALIIATPTAYLSAISACARKGILLKGGIVLDALASCKRIAFDKTGTLTTGKLSCVSITPISEKAPDCTPEEAISIAYALERNAVHPIADAITTFAKEKAIPPKSSPTLKQSQAMDFEGKALFRWKRDPLLHRPCRIHRWATPSPPSPKYGTPSNPLCRKKDT